MDWDKTKKTKKNKKQKQKNESCGQDVIDDMTVDGTCVGPGFGVGEYIASILVGGYESTTTKGRLIPMVQGVYIGDWCYSKPPFIDKERQPVRTALEIGFRWGMKKLLRFHMCNWSSRTSSRAHSTEVWGHSRHDNRA